MELGHSWNGRSPCSEVSFPVSPLYLEPGEYGHLGFTESTSPTWQGVLRVLPSSHIYSPLWPVSSLWWMWWCLWRERNGCQTQNFPYDCVNAFINSPLWRKKKKQGEIAYKESSLAVHQGYPLRLFHEMLESGDSSWMKGFGSRVSWVPVCLVPSSCNYGISEGSEQGN